MGIIGIRNYYGMWRHINFEHPATFDTLAMDPEKEEEIIDDLSSLLLARERTIIPRLERLGSAAIFFIVHQELENQL